ncbi:MAG: hypothetical protein JW822_13810 [Spirochaetales bacterium]|nr:hypothetical protein [Spirochaetales bacterium]
MKNVIGFVVLLLLAGFCFSTLGAEEQPPDLAAFNTIMIDELAEESDITVSAGPITLVFTVKPYDRINKKYHAYRITVHSDSSIFDYVKDGTDDNEIPFFAPGTGMAAARSGYEHLVVNNRANHYLFYEKESEYEQRVELMGEEDGILLVQVSFDTLYNEGEQTDFSSLSGVTLYLVVYYDENLNTIVENGEYKKITLTFE